MMSEVLTTNKATMVNPNNGKEPQLGGEFKDQVDISADAVEGKAKYVLTESTENAAAASSLTIVHIRTIFIMGVEHTFQFNKSMEEIYNAVVQYYEVNRNIEALDGVAKAQGLVQLLSLPNDVFNNTFDGMFDIHAPGFVANKNYVLEYATTKLREASTFTVPSSSAEPFQMIISNFNNAIANSINDVARTAASNLDAATRTLASNLGVATRAANGNIEAVARAAARNTDAVVRGLDAERIDRIAGQGTLERELEALTLEVRGSTPRPTPTPKKKEKAEAQPVSVRRSARIEAARKHEA